MWIHERNSFNLSWIMQHDSLKISDLLKKCRLDQTKKQHAQMV